MLPTWVVNLEFSGVGSGWGRRVWINQALLVKGEERRRAAMRKGVSAVLDDGGGEKRGQGCAAAAQSGAASVVQSPLTWRSYPHWVTKAVSWDDVRWLWEREMLDAMTWLYRQYAFFSGSSLIMILFIYLFLIMILKKSFLLPNFKKMGFIVNRGPV